MHEPLLSGAVLNVRFGGKSRHQQNGRKRRGCPESDVSDWADCFLNGAEIALALAALLNMLVPNTRKTRASWA
jgi:hypothetical protein